MHPNWKLRGSANLVQSESDNHSVYLAEGHEHAEALVLGQPSSYSQEVSSTTEDPSGTYIPSSSGITEDTGSSSAVMAIHAKPRGAHTRSETPNVLEVDRQTSIAVISIRT